MVRKWTPTSQDSAEFDREFAAARQAGDDDAATEPTADSAEFDPRDRTVTVRLRSGTSFTFPVVSIPELAMLSNADLQAVRTSYSGHGLHWDAADVHLSVPQLMADLSASASGSSNGATTTNALGAQIREAITSGDIERMRRAAENARHWLEQNPDNEYRGEVGSALREMDNALGSS